MSFDKMVLPLGFLRILINALSMTTLQLTRVPPFMNIVRTIMVTFTNRQSLRTQPSSHHVANVLSKINLQPTVVANTFIFYIQTYRYRCTYLHKTKVLYWKTSVSDHCCLACTNTVYKADTVIETIERDDECKSIETQVCRKLPGICIVHITNNLCNVSVLMQKPFLQDMKRLKLNQSSTTRLAAMTTLVCKS